MKSRAVIFSGNKNAEVREIDVPDPQRDEIQIKTISNGICMYEVWHYNNSDNSTPYIAGHEGIGIVTKTGSDITEVKEGDYVVSKKWSEYVIIPKSSIIKLSCKPEDAQYHITEPLACAVNAISFLNIYPGERAVVFGAGYMGLLLIQLLKHSPLSELVAVDIKDHNLALARQYGADRTINLCNEGDEALKALLEKPFDICYEASGAPSALDWCTKLTRPGGKMGIYAWHHEPRTVDTNAWHVKGLQVLNVGPAIAAGIKTGTTFIAADKMMSSGKIKQKDLLTHRYAIDDIQKAMKESTVREGNFIKSVLDF